MAAMASSDGTCGSMVVDAAGRMAGGGGERPGRSLEDHVVDALSGGTGKVDRQISGTSAT